jgi:putative DNA primase/helicase
MERTRDALRFLPLDNRDDWLRAGMALKSEFGDNGFDLWNEWAKQSESHNERDARSVWRSIDASGGVTIGTLFYAAKAAGWADDGAHDRPTPEELAELKRKSVEQAKHDKANIERERKETVAKAMQIWEAANEA